MTLASAAEAPATRMLPCNARASGFAGSAIRKVLARSSTKARE